MSHNINSNKLRFMHTVCCLLQSVISLFFPLASTNDQKHYYLWMLNSSGVQCLLFVTYFAFTVD